MYTFIRYEVSQHIATITFNRPEAANALNGQMLKELSQIIEHVRNDVNVYVVIFTAEGDKAFCAGADLKERIAMDTTETLRTVRTIGALTNAIAAIPQPTIAAINGIAFGGGVEIAIACDIRYAAEHAVFSLSEVALGIIPGAGGTQRLARLIGSGRAKEYILRAKKVSAKEALQVGLVEEVVEAANLAYFVQNVANEIAQKAPIALKQAKRAIDIGADASLHTALEIEALAYEKLLTTDDRLEGLQAFVEKRLPFYKGK